MNMNYVELRRCHVADCPNTTKNCGLKFFLAPIYENPEKAKRWLLALEYKPNLPTKVYICSDHFEMRYFTSTLKTRLLKGATPTLQHKVKTEDSVGSLEHCIETHFVWDNVISNTESSKIAQPDSKDMCIASIYVSSENLKKKVHGRIPKDKKEIDATIRNYLTEYYPDFIEEENIKSQTENRSSTQNSNLFPQNSSSSTQKLISCKENYVTRNANQIFVNQNKQLGTVNSIPTNKKTINQGLNSTCYSQNCSLPTLNVENLSNNVPELTRSQQSVPCLPTSSCDLSSGQLQNSSHEQNFPKATSTSRILSHSNSNQPNTFLRNSMCNVLSHPNSNSSYSLTPISNISSGQLQNSDYQHNFPPATSISSVSFYSNSHQQNSSLINSTANVLSYPISNQQSSYPSTSTSSVQQNSSLTTSTSSVPSYTTSNQQNSSLTTSISSVPSYTTSNQQNSSLTSSTSSVPSYTTSNQQNSYSITSSSSKLQNSCYQQNSSLVSSTSADPSCSKLNEQTYSPATSTSSILPYPKSYQQDSSLETLVPRTNHNFSPITSTFNDSNNSMSIQQNSLPDSTSNVSSCLESNQQSSLITSTSNSQPCQNNSSVTTSTSCIQSKPKKRRKKSPANLSSHQEEKLTFEEDLSLPSSLSSCGVASFKVVKLSYQKNSPFSQVPKSYNNQTSSSLTSNLQQALPGNTFDLKTDDDCDKFAASIAKELKNLKNPTCRRKVQFNIQNILHEAKSGAYNK